MEAIIKHHFHLIFSLLLSKQWGALHYPRINPSGPSLGSTWLCWLKIGNKAVYQLPFLPITSILISKNKVISGNKCDFWVVISKYRFIKVDDQKNPKVEI